jgi:hypothetical protein
MAQILENGSRLMIDTAEPFQQSQAGHFVRWLLVRPHSPPQIDLLDNRCDAPKSQIEAAIPSAGFAIAL